MSRDYFSVSLIRFTRLESNSPTHPRKRLPPSQKPQPTTSNAAATAASLYSTAVAGGDDDGGNCKRYTEDICIAAEDYPREAILAVLNRNARVGNDLIADVVDQSADR